MLEELLVVQLQSLALSVVVGGLLAIPETSLIIVSTVLAILLHQNKLSSIVGVAEFPS